MSTLTNIQHFISVTTTEFTHVHQNFVAHISFDFDKSILMRFQNSRLPLWFVTSFLDQSLAKKLKMGNILSFFLYLRLAPQFLTKRLYLTFD